MSFKDEINNLKETFQQTKEQGAKLGEKYSEGVCRERESCRQTI